MTALQSDDRGRVQYVDVVLTFATLVSFGAVAPWVYNAISMGRTVLDPLSGTLLALGLPMMVIALIVSVGVSGRT
ncbi:hypothetical protein EI982_14630 [Haloplanus rallus]|uniref:Uncharacterized protein n=1 Tax=Haloplanus rallus TaxID=1816183 RepID=A0A6B9FBW2_9EURY|nr:hypothetical protein [Haloplanus rallus]QGX95931.1 hypothetical protein EI982_14630 [Haloplanus rallus]